MSWTNLKNLSGRQAAWASTAIIVFTALVLLALGRVPWCACNQIWLWSGDVASNNNSQHIADPYTFSHLLHGVGFYLALWLVFRRWSLGSRVLLAVVLEASWEILENTSLIIERYRAATISLNYYGDSVVNSIFDILAMAAAFWLVAKLPTWVTVSLVIFIELFMLWWIRDNLTLNMLMLLYPVPAIRDWQAG